MNNKRFYKKKIKYSLLFFCFLLNSCNHQSFDFYGNIFQQQFRVILIVLFLMLLVVIPAIVMSVFFVWKYRENNKNKKYTPKLLNAKKIELIIWTFPIIIILVLSIISWKSTHDLDPKKETIISKEQPLDIEVVSFDWKWLFIYPKYNIAILNYLIFPVNTPIKFHVTSNSVMNSFFIPTLGSQIYAMSGMNTTLNLSAKKTGILEGMSANFSGKGFSNMKFKVKISSKNNFLSLMKKIKLSSNKILTFNDFKKISTPSIKNSVIFFHHINPKLFNNIINSKIYNKKIELP